MKQKTRLVIICCIALFLILLDLTYAYWVVTNSQTNNNQITAACLDISLSNEQNDINIPNAIPITDEEGMALTPYTFTVTNNCNAAVYYQVALESLNISGKTTSDYLSSSSLKAVLDNNESKTLNKYASVNTTISGAYESHKMLTELLEANGNATHSLRVWIDQDAPVSEQSKVWSGKISVTIGQGVSSPYKEGTITLLGSKGEDLIDYKIYGNSKQVELPDEYQGVEYIEGSGTQYIALPDDFNCDKFSIIAQYPNLPTSEQCIIGNKTSPSFEIYSSPNRKHYSLWSNVAGVYETDILSTEKAKITYDYTTKNFYINDVLKFTLNDQINQPKSLFAFTTSLKASAKIYSFKAFLNGYLKYNLIPCYRKSDNIIGMYDSINDKFYTNSGTGEFLKGNNAPSPDAPIEIKSVGDKTKNLIVYPYAQTTTTMNGITFTDNGDGSIKITGTATEMAWIVLMRNVDFGNSISAISREVGTNGQYTISKRLYYNSYQKVLSINIDKGVTIDETVYPMLLEGAYTADTMPKWEPYGYKIPIKVNDTITNIYLKEPLRKIGDYADYIDFKKQKVFRNVEVLDDTGALRIEESYKGVKDDVGTNIDLPIIPTYKGTTILKVDTKVLPSNMEVEYSF